jgi:O-antigen/teichoic acid export membrane protein
MAIARWLHAANFGVYSVIVSVASVVGLCATLGTTGLALRLIPRRLASGEVDDAARVAAMTMSTCLIFGSFAGLATAIPVAIRSRDFMLGVGAGILTLALALMTAGSNIGRAADRPLSTMAASVIAKPTLLICVAVAGLTMAASGTASIGLISTGGTTIVAFGIQLMAIRKSPLARTSSALIRPTRELLRQSPAFLIVAALSLLLSQIDILAVAAALPPVDAGPYAAASRLAAGMALVPAAVQTVYAPRIAALEPEAPPTAVTRLARSSARWATLGSLPIAIPLVVLSTRVLGLYGADFRAASWPLIWITVGILINTALGPAGNVLLYRDHRRSVAWGFCATAALNAAVSYLGAYYWGLAGAGLASGAAIATSGLITAAIAWNRAGVRTAI